MGQYYYIPDPGEQRSGFATPVPDRLAQLRQNQMQQPMMQGTQMGQGQLPTPQNTPPFQASGVQDYDNNWVSSQEEANNWLVAPGHSVIMRDVNNRYVYIKSRDANGIPAPLRIFEDTSDIPQQDTSPMPQIDLSNYITINAAEEMIEKRVNEILSERLKRPSKVVKQKEDVDNG